MSGESDGMTTPPPRHWFPAEIISHAVWLYHVFSLSLHDVELIVAERFMLVKHESVRHWCENSEPSLPACYARDG
jgi:putative transposase